MLCKTPIHTVDGVLINPFSMFSQDDKIYSRVHTRAVRIHIAVAGDQ